MKIDISPLIKGEVKKIDIDFMLTPEEIYGVDFTDDAHVQGKLVNSGGYMRLTLKISLPYTTECARCLDRVDGVLDVDFERTAVTPGMLSDEQLADNVDEYVVVEHGVLDIDEELSETLLLEFPTKVLCSEDCEGLCPVCGKPKRDGCGCVEKHIDPRWEALSVLLEKEDSDEDDGGKDDLKK